jgi:hypothetical protein
MTIKQTPRTTASTEKTGTSKVGIDYPEIRA